MIDVTQVICADPEKAAVKDKTYRSPMLVEIGKTNDIVQGYYIYNPNDGYQGYYTYRS
jgi:hypothetical protein